MRYQADSAPMEGDNIQGPVASTGDIAGAGYIQQLQGMYVYPGKGSYNSLTQAFQLDIFLFEIAAKSLLCF